MYSAAGFNMGLPLAQQPSCDVLHQGLRYLNVYTLPYFTEIAFLHSATKFDIILWKKVLRSWNILLLEARKSKT
jgi:hypothetical protein